MRPTCGCHIPLPFGVTRNIDNFFYFCWAKQKLIYAKRAPVGAFFVCKKAKLEFGSNDKRSFIWDNICVHIVRRKAGDHQKRKEIRRYDECIKQYY